jgi:hypothetical protein
MQRLSAFATLALALLPSAAYSQRHLPGEDEKIRIEKKTTNMGQAKGSRVASKRTNGVLFVLTDRATKASITIRSGVAAVKQGESEDGEFRAELAPGNYDIEVTAPNYMPFKGKAAVKLSGPAILPVELIPTMGSILIGPVEPDATILIDGQKPASISIRKAENQIEIEDVAVGLHSLRITHPSIVAWEREKIEVQGGARTYVAPLLKPALVSLIVRSEAGAEVYIDGSYKGQVTDAGSTGALELKPGEHVIRVVKDQFSPFEQTRVLAVGEATVDARLSRITFSPEFSDYFVEGGKFWTVPASWQFSRGNMLVRGAGVGFVRDRIYKDFRMEFDVRLPNSKGAVWIVRARDGKNFYMFQLSGPKGSAPNTFRSYICQDGKVTLLKSDFVAEDLSRPNDSYHVIVESSGPSIKHSIQVKSAPKASGPEPISLLSDNTFSYGAVGFTTIDGEETVVYFVSIAPSN